MFGARAAAVGVRTRARLGRDHRRGVAVPCFLLYMQLLERTQQAGTLAARSPERRRVWSVTHPPGRVGLAASVTTRQAGWHATDS